MDIMTAPTLEYANGKEPSNQWEFFEYGVKLVLCRWTALRMAVEGEWGGGATDRKYMFFLEELLKVFKYTKNVYMDDLANYLDEVLEHEFNLVCEDGSLDQVATVLTNMATDCKAGKFDTIRSLHQTHMEHPVIKLNLKQAKVDQESEAPLMRMETPVSTTASKAIDEDGFETVSSSSRRRRVSSRTKTAPQFYEPNVEFPGAQ